MHKDLLKKIKEVKKDDPFLITVTTFSKKDSKGKELDTFLFVNNFPFIEFNGTKKMINKLLDSAIKKNK